MTADDQLARVANATAEEVLRVIYGDDLEGCAVSLDNVAAAIRIGLEQHTADSTAFAELHAKAFEAMELLATPPANGTALSPEDLRSLLSERLDKIRNLAIKILGATRKVAAGEAEG